MKLKGLTKAILMFTMIGFLGCDSDPRSKIQGIYQADKSSLKTLINENLDSDNAFAASLLDKAIENAIIEVQIIGDSLRGLMFIAGESNVFNTNIEVRNDSLVAQTTQSIYYLKPNEKGIILQNINSDKGIQLQKSESNSLSELTASSMEKLVLKEKEENEFRENLGKWQKGNFVDEFGDDTGKGYPYSVLIGEHQSSAVVNSEIFVKATIEDESLYFQLFNKSMTLKERLPDSKFGTAKLKFPNGDVKNEKIFFFKNTISESPRDDIDLIYNHLLNDEGEIKILIDLSTASKYYSDKYQFTLSQNNLKEILKSLE